jgi:deoxyadenosine/deoxycytidine kinase
MMEHQSNSPIIISIEGNIGSGKSTIMEYLKNNFDTHIQTNINKWNNTNLNNTNLKICYLQEPVDVWNSFTDENGINVIEAYYKDQEKYAFPFQMMAYISRLSQLKNAINQEYNIIFTERSIHTDKNVFAKMLYDDKKISEIEYKIYNKWFEEFSECIKNMKIIYVKSNYQICFDRVIKRNRKGETIPIEYLKLCSDYHEKWLIQYPNKIIIDGNIDNEKDYSYYDDIVRLIKNLCNLD